MPKINLKPATVLLRPRVTEKSALSSSKDVYVFEVTENANKQSISASIKSLYKVTPSKIHVANIPKKQVFIRGKKGTTGGGRKAYVYLKKGDKIEVV